MRNLLVWSLAGFLGLAVLSLAAEEAKSTAQSPALERLKQLAGEWVLVDEKGQPTDKVMAIYKVTSAGTAVQETIFPGTNHEMVTLYTLDGDDLVLTHFCCLGNQPRMKAKKLEGNRLAFTFDSCGNLKSEKDPHMHEGTITFVDADHLESAWVLYKDGRPADTHRFKLARKKQ